MRNLRGWAILASALLTGGCGDLLSLHALYTAQDRVFDAAVEGRWEREREDDFLLVRRESDFYSLMVGDRKRPSDATQYEVHLVDINGVRFADIRREDAIGHMFLSVRVADGELHLAFLDSKWLRQRTAHEDADVERGDKQAVLTARTPQLRKLVGRFAHEPRAYDNELVFRRPR